MEESIEESKRSLRQRFSVRRKELLAGEEGHRRSVAVQHVLLQSAPWREARRVVLYSALPWEVGTDILLEEAWRDGKEVFLPRCRPGIRGMMDMIACGSRRELTVSPMGIAEPNLLPDSRLLDMHGRKEETLVVVPALAFDRHGFRLGYGGGYYDRFLENAQCVSVGLVLKDLLADESLPRDAWDRPVSWLCTEEGVLCCME